MSTRCVCVCVSVLLNIRGQKQTTKCFEKILEPKGKRYKEGASSGQGRKAEFSREGTRFKGPLSGPELRAKNLRCDNIIINSD